MSPSRSVLAGCRCPSCLASRTSSRCTGRTATRPTISWGARARVGEVAPRAWRRFESLGWRRLGPQVVEPQVWAASGGAGLDGTITPRSRLTSRRRSAVSSPYRSPHQPASSQQLQPLGHRGRDVHELIGRGDLDAARPLRRGRRHVSGTGSWYQSILDVLAHERYRTRVHGRSVSTHPPAIHGACPQREGSARIAPYPRRTGRFFTRPIAVASRPYAVQHGCNTTALSRWSVSASEPRLQSTSPLVMARIAVWPGTFSRHPSNSFESCRGRPT